MTRLVMVAGATVLCVVARGTTFTNISFAYGGGFSDATELISSPYVGNTYTAALSGAVLTGSAQGSTTWEFDFATSPGAKITGFQIEIDGTLKANSANAGKVSLTSLDVLNIGASGSPNVFDLEKNGGGPESQLLSNGNFSLVLPVNANDFKITTKGGISEGQVSLGDIYQVSGGATLTINQIVFRPQGTPEPAVFLALGAPVAAVLLRKRGK
jgi:hypothetical protein